MSSTTLLVSCGFNLQTPSLVNKKSLGEKLYPTVARMTAKSTIGLSGSIRSKTKAFCRLNCEWRYPMLTSSPDQSLIRYSARGLPQRLHRHSACGARLILSRLSVRETQERRGITTACTRRPNTKPLMHVEMGRG